MPSQAAKDVKFGFWVAGGFLLFAVVASILMALGLAAIGKK